MSAATSSLENAILHRKAGRLQEARLICGQVLAAEPHTVQAWQLLSALAYDEHQLEDAIGCLNKAIELDSNNAEAHNSLGIILKDQGKLTKAAEHFARAIALAPQVAAPLYNMGTVLQLQGALDGAAQHYRHAIKLSPQFAEAYHNLGGVLRKTGHYQQAIDCFQTALQFRPDLAEAHYNLATLKLLTGDFLEGWPHFEWRWNIGQAALPQFSQPPWRGEPLTGKTILIHTEQGLGDIIQFIRYAPLVKALGATAFLGCPRSMVNLLSLCRVFDAFYSQGDYVPPFDYQSPLMSLPGVFHTALDTIPQNVPYLHPAPELIDHWRSRLNAIRGFRIGVNWHGRGGEGDYRERDIPFELVVSLAELPGITLISLQKDDTAFPLGDHIIRPGLDIDSANGAFMDTAAIMTHLDLVITSDTSTPHLAGALGVPVWTALPFVPNWRWLLNRHDSPWYPTMKLFRQPSPGAWSNVFDEIRSSLLALTANSQSQS